MEIKSVENEEKKDYPKMKEVSRKKLKKKIPKKWKVLGITAAVIGVILGGSLVYSMINVDLEGAVVVGMSQQEKNIFNSQFETYEGKKSGALVKVLLNVIIANNMQNQEIPNRLVSVEYKAIDGKLVSVDYKAESESSTVSSKNSTFNNTIDVADSTLTNLMHEIISSGTYEVTLTYNPTTELVKTVTITQQ